MANYNSWYRTNYFHVSDPAAFREDFRRVSAEEIHLWDEGGGVFGFGGEGSIDGLIMPTTVYGTGKNPYSGECYGTATEVVDFDDYDYDDLDYDEFIQMLQKHLVEGDAIILTEIGFEKLRYLVSVTSVITKEEVKTIDSIYEGIKAARKMLNSPEWETKVED